MPLWAGPGELLTPDAHLRLRLLQHGVPDSEVELSVDAGKADLMRSVTLLFRSDVLPVRDVSWLLHADPLQHRWVIDRANLKRLASGVAADRKLTSRAD